MISKPSLKSLQNFLGVACEATAVPAPFPKTVQRLQHLVVYSPRKASSLCGDDQNFWFGMAASRRAG